ncbi:MAG: hypothetical protein V8R40_10885 [Dysosmobacter sp.]
MRSSAIFLGAILARCGQAEISYPGGCELGPRPIDLHLAGLRDLGAQIGRRAAFCMPPPPAAGAEIVLALPSVGATENLMLAACGAEGTTVLSNAAREPEIVDLQEFLNACGADVRGAGTSTVVIRGGGPATAAHTGDAGPDRGGHLPLRRLPPAGGDFLRGPGRSIWPRSRRRCGRRGAHLQPDRGHRLCLPGSAAGGAPVRTAPYPGFPTDAQAVLMAALLRAEGATVFEENIFENRYRHVDELTRMGADIRVMGRVAVVTGVETLHGAAGALYGPAGRGGAVRGGPGGGGGEPHFRDRPHRPGL